VLVADDVGNCIWRVTAAAPSLADARLSAPATANAD
jgi:hypothetical protein